MALSTALTAGSSDSSNLTSCEIRNYANELQEKSEALKDTPGVGVTTVTDAASTLATNAGTLHTNANTLSTDGKLAFQAQELKDAAAKKTADGLAKDANALATGDTSGLEDKAIAVIEALKKVEAAYEKLIAIATSSLTQEQQKVQAVEDAWTNVNTQFVNLCKALIKQYATEVNNQATTLKGNANVVTAKAFKDKYDTFKDVKSTIEIKAGAAGSNKNITITNLPHINNTFKPREIKNGVIIIPSIATQWLNFLTYVILLVVYLMGGDQAYR